MLSIVNIFDFRNQGGEECWKDSCSEKAKYYCDNKYHCDKCCKCFNSKGVDNVKKQTGVHPIKYSHVHQVSLPLCLDHDSFKTYICVTCQHICCRYCQHYYHSSHHTLNLNKYNEAKFRENIDKNLEALIKSKIQVQGAIDVLEEEEQSFDEKNKAFCKMLALRKKFLVAKFLYMLEDIETKIVGNYLEKKGWSQVDLEVKKDRFNKQLNNLDNMIKRIKEFDSKPHLEKYYEFNDLMEHLKSFDKPFEEEITENFTISLNVEKNKHCDDQLYKSMSELFVFDMKTKDSVQVAVESYSYEPSKVFEDILKNDESMKTFIQDKLNSGFGLKEEGKYVTYFLIT